MKLGKKFSSTFGKEKQLEGTQIEKKGLSQKKQN